MASGFIPNPFDARDYFEDEVLAGETGKLPAKFKTEKLKFEPQGSWPLCCSMATTKMVEEAIRRSSGVNWDLSQPWLFFNSGGSRTGSFFRANLETARKGNVSYASLPMPDDPYDLSPFDSMALEARKIAPDASKRILGYVRVQTDRESLKKAIFNYGMVMVGVVASGGYWKDRKKRPNKDDDHATLLVGWDVDDAWFGFDSLQPSKDFTGYHTFDKDYEFRTAYAITELPSNAKELVAEARKPGNADRYGLPRNFQLEGDNGYRILNSLKRFLPPQMVDSAGRDWWKLINAATYGGWTVTEPHKLIPFRSVPGDIIRYVEHKFLTGKALFGDFINPKQ